MHRVGYFTNMAPHYRFRLWLLLADDKEMEVHFFYGRQGRKGIREMDLTGNPWEVYRERLHALRNLRFRHVVVWQAGVLRAVLRGHFDVLVFLGDMHILSTWLAAILARMRGIPVVFWGHGRYGGERGPKLMLRGRFNQLPDAHLLYGEAARELMIRDGLPEDHLFVIYNSLDYDAHKKIRSRVIDSGFYNGRDYFSNGSLPVVIFIGRLTRVKRIDLLINAVRSINSNKPRVNLMVVGEGRERHRLEELARDQRGQVHFYGSCYDELETGRLLANADLCVSPGNIGLTAVHALSMGTPCCTHNELSGQMPEVEAIREGVNGTFFNKDTGNLKETIIRWLEKADRERVRQACYGIIDQKYNPYRQVELFRHVIGELAQTD